MEGGYTIKEGIEIARRLEATGKIDYISTDLGAADILHMNLPPSSIPPGYALEFIANVKSEVKLPVIAFGRINDPVQAESILEEGKADLIGMARALIADPELPVKAREGRLEDIRACVACNQGCVWRVFARLPITCIQNPAAGRERELGIGSLKPAAVKKRVVVVGGGPGGLKTAEIAALRGHRVTLFERLGELGGQVNIASRIPSREELSGIVRYLTYRLEKLGVDVRLNVEADVEVIKGEEPDVVVVATGSTPTVPQIPGAENLVDVASVLRGEAKVGDKVLLLDLDGHWAAAGTAEYLVERGKEVTIVTPLMYVGVDIDFPSLIPLYRKFYEKGVNMLPNTMVKEVKGETVICADVYSGREKTIEGIDTIVAAAGGKANDQLFKSLKGLFREVYAVGSCVAPRRIEMAIYEGEMVGRKI
ncbi:MAG: hypothetical protein DRO52_01495 [Candidatus Hecatellales archaeon]|nr:MAG: hypothetical protein DRO52_01495 [Candidatus Hecatellales archaeon]